MTNSQAFHQFTRRQNLLGISSFLLPWQAPTSEQRGWDDILNVFWFIQNSRQLRDDSSNDTQWRGF